MGVIKNQSPHYLVAFDGEAWHILGMTAKSTGDAPPQTRSRATVTYPYHPLDLCLKLAEAVREIGNGRQDVDKSLLAARLNINEQSPDFRQKIASAKTYGMIDGKSALQLTETAKSYFFPTNDPEKEKAIALLKFYSSPGAYGALIEAYDGSKPPPMEVLANILGQKYNIPESWVNRIATWFLRAGVTAGAIQSDGFLRYRAKLQSLGASGGAPILPAQGGNYQHLQPAPIGLSSDDGNEQFGVIVWKYPFQGKMLRIETPENLTNEIWEKLNRYIQVLKP